MSGSATELRSMPPSGYNHAQGLAQDYARRVQKQEQQVIGTSLSAGELFVGLSSHLSRELTATASESTAAVAVDVVIHKLAISNGAGKTHAPRTTAISITHELDQLALAKLAEGGVSVAEERKTCNIVIARGHQPPQCLTRLGALFDVNPLFFQRHLEYVWRGRSPRKLFHAPWPPSASFRIVRFPLFTIGDRGEDVSLGSRQHVEHLRAEADKDMSDYLHYLTTETGIEAGHSIVRAFHVHSERYYSIEQEITAIIHERADGWDALIWTDVGADLGKGPKGPWRPDIHRLSGAVRTSHFLPTPQYYPAEACPDTRNNLSTALSRGIGPFAQTASSHGLNYGSSLDPDLIAIDSFYALTEIFQISANTQSQLLNLIDVIIQSSTGYQLYKSQDFSVANLSYHQDILFHVESRLRESISDLQRSKLNDWPTLDGNDNSSNSGRTRERIEAAVSCLEKDFEQLLSRCEQLQARCTGGMTVCMNNAAIAESSRAIDQAGQVEKLTRLAFIYVPLTYATSVFGMNMGMFGQGNVKLTTWIAVSLILSALSFFILYILGQGWIRKGSRAIARSIKFKTRPHRF